MNWSKDLSLWLIGVLVISMSSGVVAQTEQLVESTEIRAIDLDATPAAVVEAESVVEEAVDTMDDDIAGDENLPQQSIGEAQSIQAAAPSVVADGEFDNQSQFYVKSPGQADPDYEDTEFGELLYNEASLPTRLEILRLLSKGTPSMLVFLHAVSMGLGIDDVLRAAVRYEPDRGRDFAASAVSILPLLSDTTSYIYSDYELEDLDRDEDTQLYTVEQVAKRFFDDRNILAPYPDWFEGQFHFEASAAELKELSEEGEGSKWYRNKSTNPTVDRPIFVGLYEANQTILIDGEDRIDQAIEENGADAKLPVVFVYNKLNERAIDQLSYPKTIRGLQQAYSENTIMLTPTPEWQTGEYHIYGTLQEIYDVFEIPTEEDFEPEHWQKLLEEAENYKVTNTAFLFVVLSSGEEEELSRITSMNGLKFAQYDDPRTEQEYPYITPGGDEKISLQALMGKGLIINRPDLIAALNTLGVTEVPISFYYINSARTKPYAKGPRALIAAAIGAGTPPGNFGGGGGFGPPPGPPVCASPPCNN